MSWKGDLCEGSPVISCSPASSYTSLGFVLEELLLEFQYTMSYGQHQYIFVPVNIFHHPWCNTENFWLLRVDDQIGGFIHLSKI